MELWIRSQDKINLVKINQISINYANKTQIIANCLPEYYENSGNYYELLGTYKTEERALEVLGEIEKMLTINLNISTDYSNADIQIKGAMLSNMVKIYDMPKE